MASNKMEGDKFGFQIYSQHSYTLILCSNRKILRNKKGLKFDKLNMFHLNLKPKEYLFADAIFSMSSA